jgi:Flp pilus assembly protein TadD
LYEALSIDPDFREAHSDLAARYAKMGRIELAACEAAFDLNSVPPEAGCNFALLLVSLKRYPEAEVVARRLLNSPHFQNCTVCSRSVLSGSEELDEALVFTTGGHGDSFVTCSPRPCRDR